MTQYLSNQAKLQAQHETNQSKHSKNNARSPNFSWYIPVLGLLICQLRRSSALADHLISHGIACISSNIFENQDASTTSSFPPLTSTTYSRQAVEILTSLIRTVNLSRCDPTTGPKRAYLLIANAMLRILIRIGATDRCVNVITQTENAVASHMNMFPLSHRVPYLYYRGMISLFREQYVDAEASLSKAYQLCPRNHANLYKILLLLIPLQMLSGKKLSPKVILEKGFTEYADLAYAISTGNMHLYRDCLDRNELFFIAKGVYIIVEKLRNVLFQNLCRKVFFSRIDGIEAVPKLRHSHLLAALRLNAGSDHVDMSIDELECILAGLIYEKKIKGYIVHGLVTIVDKNEPFPK